MTRIEAVRTLVIKYPAASAWMNVRFKDDHQLRDKLSCFSSMYRALVGGAHLTARQISTEVDALKTRAGFRCANDEHVQLIRSA